MTPTEVLKMLKSKIFSDDLTEKRYDDINRIYLRQKLPC